MSGVTREVLFDLAQEYAAGVDRRDGARFLAAFHPDGRLRVYQQGEGPEPTSQMHGHEELARVQRRILAYEKTFHLLGNASYDIGDDEATGEVYCVAHHLMPDGTTYVMYIRYQDVYRPDESGTWRIADRRLLLDWTETR